MFQPCSLPLGKMGEYHIIATAIAGNGDIFPLMSTRDLKGIHLEIYPLAEDVTWETFHKQGYRSGGLLNFVEEHLPGVQKFFLPSVPPEKLNWEFTVRGITKTLEMVRPTLYLTIGHQDYVVGNALKAPFQVAGDNTQEHDHSVYPPKPPCGLPRKPIRHREDCEHND